MLKNIPTCLSGDVLKTLSDMGHGDYLSLVDRNFPGHHAASKTRCQIYHSISGIGCFDFLQAVFPIFPLDQFSNTPFLRMEVDNDPKKLFPAHTQCLELFEKEFSDLTAGSITRQDFYKKSEEAYAIIQVDDFSPYACFLLQKGVIFF